MSKNNSVDNTNSLRFNEEKLRWDYVHFASLEPMVRVLEYGAKKYAPMNWMKPPKDVKEHLTSMMRHLTSLMDGEVLDRESGLPHIGHIMCNALFHSFHNNELNKSPVLTTIDTVYINHTPLFSNSTGSPIVANPHTTLSRDDES